MQACTCWCHIGPYYTDTPCYCQKQYGEYESFSPPAWHQALEHEAYGISRDLKSRDQDNVEVEAKSL